MRPRLLPRDGKLVLTRLHVKGAAADSPKVDRLTALPPELLETIFELAYDSCDPPGPICKAFLPCYCNRCFGLVLINSYAELEGFAKVIAAKPFLGTFTRELRIDCEDDSGDDVKPDELRPHDEDFIRLGRHLPYLETFDLTGSNRSALLALSAAAASTPGFMPSLKSLTLFSPFHACFDPYHPLFLAPLHYYRHLEKLALQTACDPDAGLTSLAPNAYPFAYPPFLLITSVSVSAHFRQAPELVRLLPSLQELHVDDIESDSQVPSVLEAVPNPTALRLLQIRTSKRMTYWRVPSAVERFSGCQSLLLIGFCDCAEPAFFDLLRQLPLRSLEMSSFVLKTDARLLKALISGPTRHGTLEHLILNNVCGEIGKWVTLDNAALARINNDTDLPEGWEEPEWPQTCSEEAVIKLVRAAKASGVRVSGTTIEAIGVAEACEKQRGLIEYLDETGAFEILL
ncbi:uncharacterized protein JCM10292_002472 [Rhodotorula paludigena]|uniref:uncharacterized protein n=1 Tax=Rhodotorula paludigena TaxID=86838 RepID=UPI0031813B09